MKLKLTTTGEALRGAPMQAVVSQMPEGTYRAEIDGQVIAKSTSFDKLKLLIIKLVAKEDPEQAVEFEWGAMTHRLQLPKKVSLSAEGGKP